MTQEVLVFGMTEYHPWDSCYSDASEDGFKEDNFTVGLGYTKYYYKLWFWNGIVTRDESLVYYQKVSETWGTPVAADCDVLTGLERSREQVQTGIEVIPNPAETEAIVRVPDKSVSGEYGYTLFNYLGSKVAEGKFFSNPFSVSLSGISPGVYLLMVTGPGGVQEGTVRIVRK